MIELLLQAERALMHGMVDEAERIYRQAIDGDPRNSIAMVGLARVALERRDDRTALDLARRALEIDPENLAARKLAQRMAEVLRYRGEAVAAGPEELVTTAEPPRGPAAPPAPATPATPATASPRGRGLLGRFRKGG